MEEISARSYDHKTLEKKWQKVWSETSLNTIPLDTATRPYYNLMMFPYPSAEGLHVGNMYAFTGSDIHGRFKRMQGYEVFEPIGLDGFGIHSENYALKIGRHPMDHAKVTQKHFYDQLHQIGAMFDFSRTLNTYDPGYYRWTQWLFVQMFKRGLAYRAKAEVNFCPFCKTVLADEQVIDGSCERCGNKVEKRLLEQWFFKITAYAEKLLQDIPNLQWSEKVKVAQTNWIGKKTGITITYPVMTEDGTSIGEIQCFTTRPDTNFGATFVVLAPDHPYIDTLVQQSGISEKTKEEIRQYRKEAKKRASVKDTHDGDRKKTGVFTGAYCLNQLNNNKMPLYISDFVLSGFGTGAVVGVPGHDLRDFQFAQAFNVPVVRVVVGKDGDTSAITREDQVQESEGTMIHSGFLDGKDIHEATRVIIDHIEEHGWGKRSVSYHLRDWLISRQRYWGPPIPMVFCQTCNAAKKGEREDMPGWYTVPESALPVLLPRIEDYKPSSDGVAPLSKHKEFFDTVCPSCGGHAVRETDVSDTFLDSSWYFLRYPSVTSPSSQQRPFDQEITRKWLPVHMYTGGAEHSVLHLLYSRYITMVLKDCGYIGFDEPFTNFYAHGLIIKDGAKMSKSKGNVVNPDEYIAKYGADAVRLYLMFIGPFSMGGDFRDSGMEGMAKWVSRVWRIVAKSIVEKPASSSVLKVQLNKTVAKVTDDMEKRRYNTAIATLMEFVNVIMDEGGSLALNDLEVLIKLLAPLAPHMTEEAWNLIFGRSIYTDPIQSIHAQPWPTYDAKALASEAVQVIVQINGKLRDTLVVDAISGKNQSKIEQLAYASEKCKLYFQGKQVKKVIFVPGKLINFVVS